MIDRLETNIQRMEAHFQKIGLDLGDDVNRSFFIEQLERSGEFLSSSAAENDDLIADAGIWNSEPILVDAEQDHSAATQKLYHTLVNPGLDEIRTVIPEHLPCFNVPRCFTDTPNPGENHSRFHG